MEAKANETKNPELVITRTFNAPRELVYNVWTKPEHLAKWWGPKGMNISVSQFNLSPGGIFLYNMQLPDGQLWWGKFVYREIVSPERLVFVNSFSNKEGAITRAPFNPAWPLEILNILTLTEHEEKTTLLIKGKPINATAEEVKIFESMFESMNEGFAGTFDQLDEYLMHNLK